MDAWNSTSLADPRQSGKICRSSGGRLPRRHGGRDAGATWPAYRWQSSAAWWSWPHRLVLPREVHRPCPQKNYDEQAARQFLTSPGSFQTSRMALLRNKALGSRGSSGCLGRSSALETPHGASLHWGTRKARSGSSSLHPSRAASRGCCSRGCSRGCQALIGSLPTACRWRSAPGTASAEVLE